MYGVCALNCIRESHFIVGLAEREGRLSCWSVGVRRDDFDILMSWCCMVRYLRFDINIFRIGKIDCAVCDEVEGWGMPQINEKKGGRKLLFVSRSVFRQNKCGRSIKIGELNGNIVMNVRTMFRGSCGLLSTGCENDHHQNPPRSSHTTSCPLAIYWVFFPPVKLSNFYHHYTYIDCTTMRNNLAEKRPHRLFCNFLPLPPSRAHTSPHPNEFIPPSLQSIHFPKMWSTTTRILQKILSSPEQPQHKTEIKITSLSTINIKSPHTFIFCHITAELLYSTKLHKNKQHKHNYNSSKKRCQQFAAS